MLHKFTLAAVLAAVASLSASSSSRADFTLAFSDGSNNATLALTSSGVLVEGNSFGIASGTNLNTLTSGGLYLNGGFASSNGATSATLVNLVFDGFQFQVAAASSNNPGNSRFANLTLSTFTVQNVGGTASSLTTSLTETNFLNPQGDRNLATIFNANIDPTYSTTTVNESSTYNDGSYTTTNTSSTGSASAPLSNQVMTVGLDGSSSPFSINDTIVITGLLNDGTSVGASVNSSVMMMPVPSGLVLIATTLPVLFLLRRRFQNFAAPALS